MNIAGLVIDCFLDQTIDQFDNRRIFLFFICLCFYFSITKFIYIDLRRILSDNRLMDVCSIGFLRDNQHAGFQTQVIQRRKIERIIDRHVQLIITVSSDWDDSMF